MTIIPFEKKIPLDKKGVKDFIIGVVDIEEESGKLVSFCVLQSFYTEEINHEIIKYDSSHGACHVHRYYEQLNHSGEDIEKEISEESFEEFWQDIEKNWREYKKKYLSMLQK